MQLKNFFLVFQDHIQEVTSKWSSIDDEIWAKLIVLERNRRVAKAYARAPVLTVNGSDDGFDGFRIGVGGFDNPMRDATTQEVIRHIGQVGRALNAHFLRTGRRTNSKCYIYYIKSTRITSIEIGNDRVEGRAIKMKPHKKCGVAIYRPVTSF